MGVFRDCTWTASWWQKLDLGAQRPRLPRRGLHWLPGELPIREIELGGAEILLSGLFAIGFFALCGVPGRPLSRFLLGGVAGGAIGAMVWVFGVSNPGLGTRIVLECIAAGLLISASVENETVAPEVTAGSGAVRYGSAGSGYEDQAQGERR